MAGPYITPVIVNGGFFLLDGRGQWVLGGGGALRSF